MHFINNDMRTVLIQWSPNTSRYYSVMASRGINPATLGSGTVDEVGCSQKDLKHSPPARSTAAHSTQERK